MAMLTAVAAIGLFVLAATSDLRWRRIPDRFAVGLAGLGLLRLTVALATGVGLGPAITDVIAAAALFAAGALLFRFGLFGGGDVKLMAAGALWLGASELFPYLFATALAGGLLALCFLVRRRLPRPVGDRRPAEVLPYGVAIAAGGILTTVAGLGIGPSLV